MYITELKNIIWGYARRINEIANDIFNPICVQYGLTMLQVRILMELNKYESQTIGSLADAILVAGTNISSMCKKMDSMGLLKRVRNSDDERIVKVTLTDKGKKIVSEMELVFDQKMSAYFDNEPIETLEKIIQEIQRTGSMLQEIVSARKSNYDQGE